MKTKTKKNPYPKSYIFAAIAFVVLFLSVWTFYGLLYLKDMKIVDHSKISILANSIAEYANTNTPDNIADIKKAEDNIKKLAEKVELDSSEINFLEVLSSDIDLLKERIGASEEIEDTIYANVVTSARNLAEASQSNAENVIASSRTSHIRADYIMMTVFILVLGAILFAGHLARKKDLALAIKEEENAILDSTAKNAKSKAYEVAYKNLTMNCGNRYALAENVAEQINDGTSFCIAKFNLGEYNNTLSIIGYDRMDNCLSRISSSIKRHYGDIGTLFTVDDESIAFVFSNKVAAREAAEKAEHIRKYINEKFGSELHINIPITGAVLCTHHFRDKSSDEILTALHSVSMQSSVSNPLPVV